MSERQIKSRKRVSERGEVFTAEREVNAMLDLVKQEIERIDSRFLEPACGNGNFLVDILRRKLEVIRRQYQKQNSRGVRYLSHSSHHTHVPVPATNMIVAAAYYSGLFGNVVKNFRYLGESEESIANFEQINYEDDNFIIFLKFE